MSEQTDDLAGFWTSVVRAVTLIPAKVPLDWAHGRERTPRAPKWTSPGARGTFDEIKTPYYPPPGFYGGASVPEIERQKKLGKEVVFRADAAFAKPEIYEALEERGVKYAIRIPANENLEREVAKMVPVTSSSTLRAVPEAPSHGVVPAVPPPNSPAGVCWCACGISQKHYP